MKKLIFILAITLSSLCYSQALQEVHFGFGFRSHFGGMQAYQNVLGYYNTNRDWLANNFSTSTYMGGFEFGLAYNEEKFGLSLLKIYRVGNKRVSKGETPAGNDFKRKITTSIWGLEFIDGWWTPLHIGDVNIGGGIMPFGTGKVRIFNKFNDEKREQVYIFTNPSFDWFSKLITQRHYYANIHFDATKNNVLGGNLHLQVFYTIGPRRTYELYQLNQKINPNTYQEIYQRTLLEINNWGVKLMLNI